jgi:hypothetical protein
VGFVRIYRSCSNVPHIPSIETVLPSKAQISHFPPLHNLQTQCALPTVSWTSAGLLLVVANVLKVLQLCLLVRRAERARVCRSIVSSRRLDRKERKRRCTSSGGKQLDLRCQDVDEAVRQQFALVVSLLSPNCDWPSSLCRTKWKISRQDPVFFFQL